MFLTQTQTEQIESIHTTAVATTENVNEGNEQIREVTFFMHMRSILFMWLSVEFFSIILNEIKGG